jgi:hypothetical protein
MFGAVVGRIRDTMLKRNPALSEVEVEHAGRILARLAKTIIAVSTLGVLLLFRPERAEVLFIGIVVVGIEAAMFWWLWSGYLLARAFFIFESWSSLIPSVFWLFIGVDLFRSALTDTDAGFVRFGFAFFGLSVIAVLFSALGAWFLHWPSLKEFLLRQRERRMLGAVPTKMSS